DLARSEEVVVHQHHIGRVGGAASGDVGIPPGAIHSERRATRPADVGAAGVDLVVPVNPGPSVIQRLPDVCLQRAGGLAPREVAQVQRARLIGEHAVIAAGGVGGGGLGPGGTVVDGLV